MNTTKREDRIGSFLFSRLMPCLLACFLLSAPHAQVATGGTYTLDQAMLANGGGTTAGTGYTVDATIGENVNAVYIAGGVYSIRYGLWGVITSPTAATVAVGGRVVDENDAGIGNVRVILMGSTLTTPRTTLTSPFGYFTLLDVEVGQTFVVSVASKRYGFGQSSQVVSVMDNVTDLVFVSTWQN